MSAEIIHYGAVWTRRGYAHANSFTACNSRPPNAMSTHKPWVTCEACKQTDDFRKST